MTFEKQKIFFQTTSTHRRCKYRLTWSTEILLLLCKSMPLHLQRCKIPGPSAFEHRRVQRSLSSFYMFVFFSMRELYFVVYFDSLFFLLSFVRCTSLFSEKFDVIANDFAGNGQSIFHMENCAFYPRCRHVRQIYSICFQNWDALVRARARCTQ